MKMFFAVGVAAAGAFGITPNVSILPPLIATNAYTAPSSCVQWYDGCNMCSVDAEGHATCTQKTCEHPGVGFCRAYQTKLSMAR